MHSIFSLIHPYTYYSILISPPPLPLPSPSSSSSPHSLFFFLFLFVFCCCSSSSHIRSNKMINERMKCVLGRTYALIFNSLPNRLPWKIAHLVWTILIFILFAVRVSKYGINGKMPRSVCVWVCVNVEIFAKWCSALSLGGVAVAFFSTLSQFTSFPIIFVWFTVFPHHFAITLFTQNESQTKDIPSIQLLIYSPFLSVCLFIYVMYGA